MKNMKFLYIRAIPSSLHNVDYRRGWWQRSRQSWEPSSLPAFQVAPASALTPQTRSPYPFMLPRGRERKVRYIEPQRFPSYTLAVHRVGSKCMELHSNPSAIKHLWDLRLSHLTLLCPRFLTGKMGVIIQITTHGNVQSIKWMGLWKTLKPMEEASSLPLQQPRPHALHPSPCPVVTASHLSCLSLHQGLPNIPGIRRNISGALLGFQILFPSGHSTELTLPHPHPSTHLAQPAGPTHSCLSSQSHLPFCFTNLSQDGSFS